MIPVTKEFIREKLGAAWEAANPGVEPLPWGIQFSGPHSMDTKRDAAQLKLRLDVELSPPWNSDGKLVEVPADRAISTTIVNGDEETLIALVHPRFDT